MKHLSALLIATGLASSLFAQSECSDGRYLDPMYFDSVMVTSAVTFGSNTPVSGGGTQTLRMDIYQPVGDVLTARPVVIVAYGGSFITGQRSDVADLCERFAHLGYVAVAPDYRVGFFFPNAHTTELAVVRCMHDLRAAIRCLRKTVTVDGNPYGIDPERIIVGGVSAGGIGALQVTYLDQSSEIPAIMYPDTMTIGGIEGNSGWPTYSSDVVACWSMSGAIGDTSWIQPGDQPCISLHEEGDGVVPYGTQEVSVIGIPTGLIASGSSDVHRRLDHEGVPNCFVSYPGTQHVGYLTYDTENAFGAVARFCADVVCGQQISCGQLPLAVATANDVVPPVVYPNPTMGQLNVHIEERSALMLMDAAGRAVLQLTVVPGAMTLDLSALPNGMYTLRIQGTQIRTSRVVKVD
jgi:acetyl esterase/lipase